MKFIIVLIFFYVGSVLSVFGTWQRNVINYERGIYQAGFQNWMTTQSENGWLYFANSGGLLEFDGVYWNLYPIKNKLVRSLRIIGNRIYVGLNIEFGYFEPNDVGQLKYHSLSEDLPDFGGDIWSIVELDGKIYFLSDYNIFIHAEGSKIVNISTDIKIDYCSTVIDNRLYIASTEGLFYLDNKNSLKKVEQSNRIVGEKIVGLSGYKNKILVTTSRSGLYFIDNVSCVKVQSVADRFISSNQLFCSAIDGSKVALGSVQNGVFLFDLEDAVYKETFNLTNGLKNNTVLNIIFDRNKNLWLGLDKGIGYIDLSSPVRPLYTENSPIGTGYCSVVYNDELYLGTNQGLYKKDASGEFKIIRDSEGQVWSLKIIDNTLFSSGDNGIFVITPRSQYKINLMGMGAWGLERISSDKNKLMISTYSGLKIINKVNAVWGNVQVVKGFNQSCRGFIEDEVSKTFWMANTGSGIHRITIDADKGEVVQQKEYSIDSIGIGGNVFFRKIDNNIVVCGEKGVYQYSRISDSFTPYAQLQAMLEGTQYYDFLDTDSSNNIWFVSDKRLKLLRYKQGNYSSNIIDWGLENELINGSENVTLLDSVSAIVSVDKAFLKIDLSKVGDNKKRVDVFIRKLLTTKNDSVISYGVSNEVLNIPYSKNSIHIQFAAAEYVYSSDVVYSYRLVGLDEKWSTSSSKTMKEYNNLTEGKYTFEVRASVYGQEYSDNVASVSFTILPPWYRLIWAYIGYILLFVAAMLLVYRKTIKKQKLIILKKGEELEEQSRQYEKERMLKDKEIYELQNENLRNNLNFKTQELTGHILNLIRKNEMLEEVRRGVMSISKALDESKDSVIIKQKVVRLTSNINNNIERDKDFEVFQSNFNLTHTDFFKLLEDKYPNLTRNDKILCAYLKMNLSSKEIAPLLNISLRGVEVNRYRLRKKMNLDREVNLTEFMQNLSSEQA